VFAGVRRGLCSAGRVLRAWCRGRWAYAAACRCECSIVHDSMTVLSRRSC